MKLSSKYRKALFSILLIIMISLNMLSEYNIVRADEIVVCVDAGHGGKNLGARWQGFTEKDVNLHIAKVVFEELSKYQGIKVGL